MAHPSTHWTLAPRVRDKHRRRHPSHRLHPCMPTAENKHEMHGLPSPRHIEPALHKRYIVCSPRGRCAACARSARREARGEMACRAGWRVACPGAPRASGMRGPRACTHTCLRAFPRALPRPPQCDRCITCVPPRRPAAASERRRAPKPHSPPTASRRFFWLLLRLRFFVVVWLRDADDALAPSPPAVVASLLLRECGLVRRSRACAPRIDFAAPSFFVARAAASPPLVLPGAGHGAFPCKELPAPPRPPCLPWTISTPARHHHG